MTFEERNEWINEHYEWLTNHFQTIWDKYYEKHPDLFEYDDIYQEYLECIIRKLDRMEYSQSSTSELYYYLYNSFAMRAKREVRKSSNAPKMVELDPELLYLPDLAAHLWIDYVKANKELRDVERDIFISRVVDGYSISELAELYKRTKEGVRQIYISACKKIADQLFVNPEITPYKYRYTGLLKVSFYDEYDEICFEGKEYMDSYCYATSQREALNKLSSEVQSWYRGKKVKITWRPGCLRLAYPLRVLSDIF